MTSKNHRLTREHNLESLFASGKKVVTPFFVFYIRETVEPFFRFSVVVPSKVSKKAIERNFLKRRIRAIILELLPSLKNGIDMVIRVQRNDLVHMRYLSIKEEIIGVFRKASLLMQNTNIKM